MLTLSFLFQILMTQGFISPIVIQNLISDFFCAGLEGFCAIMIRFECGIYRKAFSKVLGTNISYNNLITDHGYSKLRNFNIVINRSKNVY